MKRALLLAGSGCLCALLIDAQAPPPKTPDFSDQDVVIEREDRRVRIEDDGTGQIETTLRLRLVSEAGVRSGGLIRMSYDSGAQSLELRDVRVFKPNGEVVTPSLAQILEVTAPVASQAPMYSEYREKHFAVPDLHPGDSVEHTSVVSVRKPRAPGQFWYAAAFRRDAIALDERLEIDVPRGRSVQLRPSAGLTPRISETADRRVYRFTHSMTDTEAVSKARRLARRGWTELPDVALSTFTSWEDVGAWYAGLERDRDVPTPEVRAKANEVTRGLATDEEKIKALYEYVSRNVRYVSVSLGMASMQPHAATETLANAYGDCKDKHTLLAALLASVGIPAYAALVRSFGPVDEAVPAVQFDHVITAVPRGKEYLWLDTTSEVGPVGWLAPQLRGQLALVVSIDKPAQLARTPAEPVVPNEQLLEVDGRVDASGKLVAHQRSRLEGDTAVLTRGVLRLLPQGERVQTLERQISSLVEAISLQADVLKATLPDEASRSDAFEWSADYSIEHLVDTASATTSELLLRLPDWLGRLPAADELTFAPDGQLRLPGATTFRLRAKIALPDGWIVRPPDPAVVSFDFADYRSVYSLEEHVLVMERTLTFKAHALPESRAEEYERLRSQLAKERRVFSVEKAKDGARPDAAAEAEALVKAGVADCYKHEYVACASTLVRAVELAPGHQEAWNELGRAYLALRDYDHAASAFQRQVELVPTHPYAYNNLGLACLQAHREVEAEIAFRKQLEVSPQDRFAHRNLGYLLNGSKRYAEAVAEFEKAAAIEPRNAAIALGLGRAYLGLEKDAEAMAAFDKAFAISRGSFTRNSAAYALAEASKHLDQAQEWSRSAVAEVAAQLGNAPPDRLEPADADMSRRLSENWDTLGWIYFRQGDTEHALAYLEPSFGLSATAIGADHLGQVYDKRGEKSKALHAYALAVSLESQFAEARGRLVALASGEKEAADLIARARAELPQLGALSVVRPGMPGQALSTDVLVALGSSGRVLSARLLAPSAEAEAMLTSLIGAKHGLVWPDPAPTRLVKRGRFVCPLQGGDCQLSFPQPDLAAPIVLGIGLAP